ncbi:Mitochondrial assembly of ribosomal large subunit protein 1 [Clonorchis sinensis]|uniref:Mitochondrial assembly of ribosomal large subunit protein 1 n=2 Tax=Clonorchis sinensis TaxID=79923 RepID=A0A8T1MSD2_CLOSI|nr:Mitochondrial assembly of ribosomal large subunit protein 1 [Clonorchis sinensis]
MQSLTRLLSQTVMKRYVRCHLPGLSRCSLSASKSSRSDDSKPIQPVSGVSAGQEDVYEIHDVDPEQQWEENPEFDYASLVPVPSDYDFISTDELFQLQEIHTLLRQENIRDPIYIRLPPNHITDFMVIGSGVSRTHVRSTAALVYKILKFKRKHSSLGLPRVEGLDGSGDWIALNLGNILLHLFMPMVRARYDLESLWAAGPQFDETVHGVGGSTERENDTYAKTVDWDQLIREVRQNLPNSRDPDQRG